MGVNAGVVISSALFVHVFSIRLAGGIIQSGGVEVKGLVAVVTPAILLAESILLDLNDLNVSADTGTANNEVNSSMSKLIKKSNFRADTRARDQRNGKAILKGYFD